MKQLRDNASMDFASDHFGNRVQEWLDGPGGAEIEHALAEADEASELFQKAIRLDPKTLNEPVTL